MSSTDKDFYKILGVIDSAELAVIKAAYKALMQIYHPDKYKGETTEAVRKSKEINEAYTVLTDPVKRKKYDVERSARKNRYEPEQESRQEEKEFTNAKNDILEAEWNIALEHVKGLNDLYQGLSILSQDLAFTFKLEILETKRFSQAILIAKLFEQEFLDKYFGKNKDIQAFSYWLLKNGKRDVAKEVNKIVTVLGSDIVANDVIETLVKKYKLFNYKGPSSEDERNEKTPTQVTSKASEQQYYQKQNTQRGYAHPLQAKSSSWRLIAGDRGKYTLKRGIIEFVVLFFVIGGLLLGMGKLIEIRKTAGGAASPSHVQTHKVQ